MLKKRQTRQVKVGNIAIGGGAPLSVQSMTNTKTSDRAATARQINELSAAGCDIVRIAVPDRDAVAAIPELLSSCQVPLIADIHFDYRLAIGAIEAGIHGLRLNPGNIKNSAHICCLADLAKEAEIPIRVGANAGSVPVDILARNLEQNQQNRQEAMAATLVECALLQCQILEQAGFSDIKVSLKASDVRTMVQACRKFAEQSDYPLHLGVTEAGTKLRGTIKSAVGIGALLLDGIGDTIRISLTADPLAEVEVGLLLLESLGLREGGGPELISCPTCGRTDVDLFKLVEQVEKLLAEIKSSGKRLDIKKIAVMGCVVNGPGEARDAELGICGGHGKITIFRHGEKIAVYPESAGFAAFSRELMKHVETC